MAMVRPPKKHSMVMVSSKTIENLQWSLQNHWNLQWFPKNHWTCQWSSQINIILKVWNYPVVTISILIWLVCSKVWISCLDIYCPIAVANQIYLMPIIILHALYSDLVSSWIIHSNRSSVHDITFYMVFMTFWDILSVVLC